MNKLKDAIYGQAVADALGVPFEFNQRGTFQCVDMVGYGTYHQPAGTWSDDTSMTLATMWSIKKQKKIDCEDILSEFKNWYFKGDFTPHRETFDIGTTTRIAITQGKGLSDVSSNGNGSLMRIMPLAFVEGITEDDVQKVSSITHAHPISVEACQIFINILKQMLAGKNLKDILPNLEINLPVFKRIKEIEKYPEAEIKSTGYVVDTLEAALWCFLKTNDYQSCVLKAVNLGNDTDTVAGIAGILAGIYYGLDNIPLKWLKILVNKEEIDRCIF